MVEAQGQGPVPNIRAVHPVHPGIQRHVQEQLLENWQHPDQEAQLTEAPHDKQLHVPTF
jgi:hypothetical protein